MDRQQIAKLTQEALTQHFAPVLGDKPDRIGGCPNCYSTSVMVCKCENRSKLCRDCDLQWMWCKEHIHWVCGTKSTFAYGRLCIKCTQPVASSQMLVTYHHIAGTTEYNGPILDETEAKAAVAHYNKPTTPLKYAKSSVLLPLVVPTSQVALLKSAQQVEKTYINCVTKCVGPFDGIVNACAWIGASSKEEDWNLNKPIFFTTKYTPPPTSEPLSKRQRTE